MNRAVDATSRNGTVDHYSLDDPTKQLAERLTREVLARQKLWESGTFLSVQFIVTYNRETGRIRKVRVRYEDGED